MDYSCSVYIEDGANRYEPSLRRETIDGTSWLIADFLDVDAHGHIVFDFSSPSVCVKIYQITVSSTYSPDDDLYSFAHDLERANGCKASEYENFEDRYESLKERFPQIDSVAIDGAKKDYTNYVVRGYTVGQKMEQLRNLYLQTLALQGAPDGIYDFKMGIGVDSIVSLLLLALSATGVTYFVIKRRNRIH